MRILIALILAIPLYIAVPELSYWLYIPITGLQLFAGLDFEIFERRG